jgi:hypothetical protein
MKLPARCISVLSASLLIGLTCSLVLSGLSCCAPVFWQEGGPAIYDVTASTKQGREFVDKYDVKYICENVVSIYGADVSRSKSGVFAIDVEVLDDGRIRYKPLPAAIAVIYGLEPRFTWWHKHGCWVAFPLACVMIGLTILIVGAIRYYIFGWE